MIMQFGFIQFCPAALTTDWLSGDALRSDWLEPLLFVVSALYQHPPCTQEQKTPTASHPATLPSDVEILLL